MPDRNHAERLAGPTRYSERSSSQALAQFIGTTLLPCERCKRCPLPQPPYLLKPLHTSARTQPKRTSRRACRRRARRAANGSPALLEDTLPPAQAPRPPQGACRHPGQLQDTSTHLGVLEDIEKNGEGVLKRLAAAAGEIEQRAVRDCVDVLAPEMRGGGGRATKLWPRSTRPRRTSARRRTTSERKVAAPTLRTGAGATARPAPTSSRRTKPSANTWA